MSGHSKWATIKRKKGAQDAKRSQVFTKLANAITVAARDGADPDTNFRLRLAIDKARAVNMPVANIERAIARGGGTGSGAQIDQITYEGYGPAGIALIVETATDNRNRTYSDVRNVFSKSGGNMAEAGAVAFQFDHKGIITIETSEPEGATLAAIDAGAEDIEEDEGVVTVYTNPKLLNQVRTALALAGWNIASAELGYVPKQRIAVSDEETARKILRLLDSLEDLDDVSATYSNFDIPTEILEKVG